MFPYRTWLRRAQLIGMVGLSTLSVSCSSKAPPSEHAPEKATSVPASRPSSLPVGHSTSTVAVDLKSLFIPPDPLPKVVAKVSDEPLTKEAYIQELRQMQIQFSATGVPAEYSRAMILHGALKRAVDHILLEQLAKDLNVTAQPKAIEAWLASLKQRTEDDPAFAAFLLRAGKDDTQKAIDARREVLYRGISQKISDEVAQGLEEEAKSYYDRHSYDYILREGIEVWRIFVRAPAGMNQRDRDLAEDRAKDIYKVVKKDPKKFKTVAITKSDGGKASDGGFLGYVPEGALEEKLYEQVKAAKPNDILPIWTNAAGFGIYKVGKHREESTISFEEARPSIIASMFGPTLRREVEKRIDTLRSKKKIEIMVAELRKPMTSEGESQPQK